MKYLLDTHVWLWLLDAPQNFPVEILQLLKDMRNAPLGLSAISPWEVAKKHVLGKLDLSMPIGDWMREATCSRGIAIIPISPEISVESCHLPGNFHRDPADQIIVATARKHKLTLITKDELLRGYSHVKTLWE